MFFFSPLYLLLVGPAIALSIWAQFKVRSAFNRYSKVMASSGITGAEAARRILADSDRQVESLQPTEEQPALRPASKPMPKPVPKPVLRPAFSLGAVAVQSIGGQLTDHYDPRERVLRLSQGVYEGRSLASLGVAAHEAGHALQDAYGYTPMKIRHALVPAASLGTNLGPILIILGIVFLAGAPVFSNFLLQVGILVFAAAVVFQVVTLPVEYDASRRAMGVLSQGGYVTGEEYAGTKAVLDAAALTYLAAALAAVMQLIYFILLSRNRD